MRLKLGGRRAVRPCSQLDRQRLGRPVQTVDIVVGEVEPVAHFLPRKARGSGAFAGQGVVEHLQASTAPAIFFVERNEPVGELGRLLREANQLGIGDVLRKQRVCVGLAQRRQTQFSRVGGDRLPVERKHGGQTLENRCRQRALVVFQLREVAGAQRQRPREISLAHPAVRPESGQPFSGEYPSGSRHSPRDNLQKSGSQVRKFASSHWTGVPMTLI